LNYHNLNYINFTQKELTDLFTSAKEGDAGSFESLSGYVRNISYTYFFSKLRQGRLINREDVDDLTNNVYLSFAEQYHKVENIEFWLRRVLFLNFINFYKKSKEQRTFELKEASNIEQTKPILGDKVDVDKIVNILNTFSEDKQNILKMRFWEDLKFCEIAENLGKSEDAVKKMFYRTIEELKSRL